VVNFIAAVLHYEIIYQLIGKTRSEDKDHFIPFDYFMHDTDPNYPYQGFWTVFFINIGYWILLKDYARSDIKKGMHFNPLYPLYCNVCAVYKGGKCLFVIGNRSLEI